MKVVSVNTGERKMIKWRSRNIETGIFKLPVDQIHLGTTDVENDQVVDRKYHGGIDKACYLFSADDYGFWKEKYPSLEWDWGMFGENITISGLDESDIFIGSTYQIGTAVIEVSQPREPCFKLGIRFGTQKVLKDFIAAEQSGVYVRVLKEGIVKPGDEMTLLEKGSDISVKDIFQLIYKNHQSPELVKEALKLNKLAESVRKNFY